MTRSLRTALLIALGVLIVIVLALAIVLLKNDTPRLEAVAPDHVGINSDPTGQRWLEMTVCLTNPGAATVTSARIEGDAPQITGLRDDTNSPHGAVRVEQECLDVPSYEVAAHIGSYGGQRLMLDVDGQSPDDADNATVILTYRGTTDAHDRQLEVTIPPVR
ncbi:MAG: hypothetical protein Q4G43_04035 [Mobilicoccus sp.]|nr:hypothetical protein [Mobilicoccus sp.]